MIWPGFFFFLTPSIFVAVETVRQISLVHQKEGFGDYFFPCDIDQNLVNELWAI